MTLIEAMEHVKRGYYIRRSWWKPESVLAPVFFDFARGLAWASHGWESFLFSIDDILATDWEVGGKWEIDRGAYPEEEIAKLVAKDKRYIVWQLERRKLEAAK